MTIALIRFVVIALFAMPGNWLVNGQTLQGNCHVSGHVYAVNDKPLAGAGVRIFPLQVAWNGTMPTVTTDSNGYYSFYLPAIGKTRIYAVKKEIGYPDTFYSLFSSGTESDPVKDLSAETNFENVDIHLGPPDGTIEVTIVDKKTGMLVPDARITLRRKDDRSTYFSVSSREGVYSTPLPEKPILIEITAAGYRPWHYISTSPATDFVQLKADEHRLIRAELFPITSSKE